MKWKSGLLLSLAAGAVAVSCAKENVNSAHLKDERSSELVLRQSAHAPECGINGIEYEQIEVRQTFTDMDCPGSRKGIHKRWEHVCHDNHAGRAFETVSRKFGRTAVYNDAGRMPGWPGWEYNQERCNDLGGTFEDRIATGNEFDNLINNVYTTQPSRGELERNPRAQSVKHFRPTLQWVTMDIPDEPATCERVVNHRNGREILKEVDGSVYKSCQIYKTKDELQTFVDGRYDALKSTSEAAVLLEANYYVSFRKTAELACLHAALASHAEIQGKVATLYKNFFGSEPSPGDTCAEFKTLTLKDTCDTATDSLKCKTIKSIADSRGELERVRSQFNTISDNVNGIVSAYAPGSQESGRGGYSDQQVKELARVKQLLEQFGIKN